MLLLVSGAIIVMLIILAIIINMRTVAAVKSLSGDPKDFCALVSRPETDAFKQAVVETDQFAREANLKPYKLLNFELPKQTLQIATWHDPNSARSLIMFYHKGRAEYDIISHFADKTRLSTTNQADSHFLPLGNSHHIQNFTHLSLAHLLGEHRAGEQYLANRHELAIGIDGDQAFKNILTQFAEHMQAIQEKSLWQLRGAYWYLWRRNLRANTSIKTLHKLN